VHGGKKLAAPLEGPSHEALSNEAPSNVVEMEA
jgi:hypothetical protein